MARPTRAWRSPAMTASAERCASAQDEPPTGFDSTPGANWRGAPTTAQMLLEYWPDLTRFMTTVPTAFMPSSLERLDSKYMARAMQSRSLRFA